MAVTLQSVIDQMAEWEITGLGASELDADGKYHRFKPDGQKGSKKSGWYILWEHQTRAGKRVFVGAFGKGPDTFKVKPSDSDWTMEERAEFAASQKAREKEAARLRKEEGASAAQKAEALWNRAHEGGASPYLDRKSVKPVGIRFLRDTLLIPARGVDGQLRGCQYISADGSKRFNTGMEKAGAFHVLGEISPGGRLLFAEGYATAASLHMASGYPVVMCFDANNLDVVAKQLRPLYPDADFIFCGDDDRHLRRRLRERLEVLGLPGDLAPDGTMHVFHLSIPEGGEQAVRVLARFEPREGVPAIRYSVQRDAEDPREYWIENAGRKHALACAKLFKGVAVFPSFPVEAAGGTDFNDVHLAEGLGVVRSQLLSGIQEAQGGGKGRQEAAHADTEPGEEWQKYIRHTDRGRPEASLYNTLLVLENDPQWKGLIAHDDFAQRYMKLRPPPGGSAGEWSDVDDVLLTVDISRRFRFEPKKQTVMDAVMHIGNKHAFHPVKQYFDTLEWDGKPRIAKAFQTYWGALSTPDTASLGKGEMLRLRVYLKRAALYWFVGAVARVMEPGVKLDTMVVFEGGQGAFKSSALKALFGAQWFADSKLVIGDKDALAQMMGKWGYEMAELDAFSKAEDNLFKLFMSSSTDRWREHYGKRARDVLRQSIFIGTTNQSQYGKDPTGMRRCWPVLTGLIDRDGIRRDRDQLWAEALHLYREGLRHWVEASEIVLDPKDERLKDYRDVITRPWTEGELFKEQADSRQIHDAWQTLIETYVYDKVSAVKYVTAADVLENGLSLDAARWSRPEQMRVTAILQRMGWIHRKTGPSNRRIWAWFRPETVEDEPGENKDGDDGIPF